MKANELRIGNYALYPSSNLENGEDIIEVIKVTSNDIKELELKYILYAIPLTEEWLVRFGFKVGNHKQFNKWINEYENSSLFVDDNYYGIAINGIDVWTISRKLYVHQLQNLYFALTGEELEIK